MSGGGGLHPEAGCLVLHCSALSMEWSKRQAVTDTSSCVQALLHGVGESLAGLALRSVPSLGQWGTLVPVLCIRPLGDGGRSLLAEARELGGPGHLARGAGVLRWVGVEVWGLAGVGTVLPSMMAGNRY